MAWQNYLMGFTDSSILSFLKISRVRKISPLIANPANPKTVRNSSVHASRDFVYSANFSPDVIILETMIFANSKRLKQPPQKLYTIYILNYF